MNNTIYILIALVVLAIVAVVLALWGKKWRKPVSRLNAISLLFVIAGITFGDNKFLGYGLIGVGLILVIIDIFIKIKVKEEAK